MNKKLKIIIPVILFITFEVIGIFIGIKYKDDVINGTGYEGRVVEVNDTYVTATCVNNNVCERDGEKYIIKISKPENVKLESGDTIYFKHIINYNNRNEDEYYYVKSKEELNRMMHITELFTLAPIGGFFFYFVYYFVFKNEINKIYRYIPSISLLSFMIGYFLTIATENDSIQMIGLFEILLPFLLPFIAKKICKE